MRDTAQERYDRNRKFVREFLEANPCIDCFESDYVVLEFDHVKGHKIDIICNMIRKGVSLLKLKNEIAKCVVRCANCHRRKTATQLGWYTVRM